MNPRMVDMLIRGIIMLLLAVITGVIFYYKNSKENMYILPQNQAVKKYVVPPTNYKMG